jgi:hypothetical protein
MVMTPAALLVVLRNMGYPVTLRCLIDWRMKDLLPPLKLKGRGKRKGVLRYWSQKNIVRRAIAIYRSLRCKRRTRSALISLYVQGFRCNEARVRHALVEFFNRRDRASERPIRKLAGPLARFLESAPQHVGDVLIEARNAVAVSYWQPNRDIDFDLLVNLFNQFGRAVAGPVRWHRFSREMTTDLFREFRASFSAVGLCKMSASASDQDLRLAQRKWIRIWNWFDKLFGYRPGDPKGFRALLETLGYLGPTGIALLLPAQEFVDLLKTQ